MDKKRKITNMTLSQLEAVKASLEKKITITRTVKPKTKPEYTVSYQIDHKGSRYYRHICDKLAYLKAA